MPLAVLRPLAFGEVLDQAFGLFRRAFIPLLIVSVVCSGVPALLSIGVQAQGGVMKSPVMYVVALILAVIGSAIASGASTFIVSEQYLGQELEAGEALHRAWGRAWEIFLTSMGVGLMVFLGLILFIVPGVIAFAGLSLAVTAVAIEGISPDKARGRSWELTKGYRWRMLGLVLIYGIIAWITVVATAVVAGIIFAIFRIGAGESGPEVIGQVAVVGTALSSLLMLAINPLLYCILIVAYYDLRVRKEAFDLDLLATTMEQAAVPRPA